MMLRDRGVGVPDAQDCHATAAPALRYRELQRAVADYIGFGAWCDPMAWSAQFTEDEHLATGTYALALRAQWQKKAPRPRSGGDRGRGA